jgi:quinol-cytochrome oxidoreductase complex cytochrome b subunit
MTRRLVILAILVLTCGVLLYTSSSLAASPQTQSTPTPAFDSTRFTQPSMVTPPSQADNGAQLYWGMCLDCHGDRLQGLTEEWRSVYPASQQDCWQSGCHGVDYPPNSFMIPETGAPALAGSGSLTRFANAFELEAFIRGNMPLFPPGSLALKDSWSLAAYILRLNDREPVGLTLNAANTAAIPLHRQVDLPENALPGTLALVAVLFLAALGLSKWIARAPVPDASRPSRANFVAHLHPPRIPALQSRFRYTLAAGGLAVFFSLILLLTGLLEMYYYVPSPGDAPVSVQTLITLVPYGSLVRNLHYWAAQFLVIIITIHLLRVVLTGAYAPPRRLNFLIGLALLVLILLLDFTGYVLRWDEGIRWALVVGANLLKTIPGIGAGLYKFVVGGSAPGLATLTRFYTWHIFGLTVGVAALVIWHIFRTRRDGGIAASRPCRAYITRFDLLRREVLAMVVAGIVLLLFSALIPAPIDQPISTQTPLGGDSRAPWFFLWIQQLLKLGSPFVWGVLIPVLVVVVLGLLPYILPNARDEELGRWFPRGNRVAQVIAASIVLAVFVLTLLGSLFRQGAP